MNVLVIDRKNISGIPFYRTIYPYTRLAKKKDISVDLVERIDALKGGDYLKYDIVVFGRPSTEAEKKAIINAKVHQCKVVVDVDDNLFQVPRSNPASHQYPPERLKVAMQCLALSDAVTVSTKPIKEIITKLFEGNDKNIHILPNAWPNISATANQVKEGEKIRIAWRGSLTHGADIYQHRETFYKISESEDHILHWWGDPHNYSWKTKYHTKSSFFPYINSLKGAKPHFLYFPLQDHPFNHSKSNISWIEATVAGAMMITNLTGDHWSVSGMGHNSKVMFQSRESINRAIQRSVTSSVKTISEKYDLDTINEKRLKVLKGLCGLS